MQPQDSTGKPVDRDDIVLFSNFAGYENCDDITTMEGNVLCTPSQNVLITGLRNRCVETRNGYKLLGQPRTQLGYGIRSKYDDFVNNLGVKLPIREHTDNLSQSFPEVFFNGLWRPIKGAGNFPHEIYFTEFYEDKTTLPYLVMVGGLPNIYTWNGGISMVTATTINTITVADPIQPLGFGLAGGVFSVGNNIFNYTGVSGNQFTGVTPDPTGLVTTQDAVVQFILTNSLQRLGQNLSSVPSLDITTTLDNHVFYGSYASRTFYIANSFGTIASATLTAVSTNLNDLTIAGTYVGPTDDKIKIEIDTVPPPAQVSYTVAALNDAFFSGFHTGGGRDTYTVTINAIAPDSFLWSKNGGAPVGPVLITGAQQTLSDGVQVAFGAILGHTIGDTWSYTVGGSDTYKWYLNDVVQASAIPVGIPLVYNGVTFSFGSFIGHTLGSYWEIQVLPPIRTPYADVYYDVNNRKPGQGATPKLDSPPVSFNTQERYTYATSRNGQFSTINFTLSADLKTETVAQNVLKTDNTNKILRQELTANTKNKLVFISVENQLCSIGRVENIFESPMVEVISRRVQNDFIKLPFVISDTGNYNGQVDTANNKIYVTCPDKGLLYIYEDLPELQFWQAPQVMNISAISIINGQTIGHSSISDESYVLFSASNDNGYQFKAVAAFPYMNTAFHTYTGSSSEFDRRDQLKEYQTLFTESYKSPNTNMYARINFDYGGCTNIKDFRLDPIVCTPVDQASLGKAELGQHGLGNDPEPVLTKFRHTDSLGVNNVYETQVIYYSDSIDCYFKLVSYGLNAALSDVRNVAINQQAKTTVNPAGDGVEGTNPFVDGTTGPNVSDPISDTNSS